MWNVFRWRRGISVSFILGAVSSGDAICRFNDTKFISNVTAEIQTINAPSFSSAGVAFDLIKKISYYKLPLRRFIQYY